MEKKSSSMMETLFDRFIAWQRGNKPGPIFRTIVANHNVPPDIGKREHPNKKFKKNEVKTTKYTLITFLPKNLFEQLHRFANIFFLFILFLNWIPQINAFAKEVAMLPVLFVFSVTAVKDAFEDYRRYHSDKKINNQKAKIFNW
jgi:phospholipid-translocating ATPase